eukprot:1189947-Prorocentrum_minimum.AAC.2
MDRAALVVTKSEECGRRLNVHAYTALVESPAIGPNPWNILSSPLRLVPTPGIFSQVRAGRGEPKPHSVTNHIASQSL